MIDVEAPKDYKMEKYSVKLVPLGNLDSSKKPVILDFPRLYDDNYCTYNDEDKYYLVSIFTLSNEPSSSDEFVLSCERPVSGQ